MVLNMLFAFNETILSNCEVPYQGAFVENKITCIYHP